MAASYTTLSVSTRGTINYSNDTSKAFTPAANACLFAHFHGLNTTGGASPGVPTISDSAGLTWKTWFSGNFNSSNRQIVATAQVGASPASMTVSANWGSATSYGFVAISQTTGHNSTFTFASGSTVQTTGTSTTPNVGTVSALTSTGDLQVLFVASRGASATPEAGWTEMYDAVIPGVNIQTAAFMVATPGDTTPTATLNASVVWRAIHFEVYEDLSASGDGVVGTSTALRASRRRRR